jgi:heptosyltransferase-3
MNSVTRVQRFDGRDLGQAPHIAVLGSCKLGNFVVSLPLLRLLRRRYPQAQIDFWGSEATADFERALCGDNQPLDWRISWDQPHAEEDNGLSRLGAIANAADQRQKEAGPLDLAINCDGFNPLTQTLTSWLQPIWVAGGSLRADGRAPLAWGDLPHQRFLADPDWDTPAFLARYAEQFTSNYIAELLCRMAFLEPNANDLGDLDLPWEEPGFEVPPLLIHTTTTRAAKIWPFQAWDAVLRWCTDRSITVGLVGAPPARQRLDYHAGDGEEQLLANHRGTLIDLRGRTNLIQLAGASRLTRAVLSVDAGPMHVAAGVGTPTLAIVGNDTEAVGASPIRLWLPRSSSLTRTVSSSSCSLCSDNRFRNDGCLVETHHCMEGVDAQQVIQWLEATLA